MATNPLDFLYEEDVTGVNPANRVVDEVHFVTPGTPGDFNVIIPKYTPFFKDSVRITHVASGKILVLGIDWQPGYNFATASYETEWVQGGIYGAILLMNSTLTGEFRINRYQTLGGNWLLSNDKILEILSNRLIDPRTYYYEQVSGKPEVFPPLAHTQPSDDVTGIDDVVVSNMAIAQAIREQTQKWIDNPPILMSEYFTKAQTIAEIADRIEARTTPIEENIVELFARLNSLSGNVYTKAESDAKFATITTVNALSTLTTNYLNMVVGSSNATLAVNRRYIFTGAVVATLPALSSIAVGQSIEVARNGLGDTRQVEVRSVGTDRLDVIGGLTTSLIIPEGATIRFVKLSTSTWGVTEYNHLQLLDQDIDSRIYRSEAIATFAPIGLVDVVGSGLGDRYTKAESDDRFAPRVTTANALAARYTKSESDGKFATLQEINTLSTFTTNYIRSVQNQGGQLAINRRYTYAIAATVTLPALSTVTTGDSVEIISRGISATPTSHVTVNVSGSDVISLNDGNVTTLALPPMSSIRFTKFNATSWIAPEYSLIMSLRSSIGNTYTKTESDARFAPISLVNTVSTLNTTVTNGLAARYTKTESDNRFAPISLVTTVNNLSATVTNGLAARYTKTESDARYAPIGLSDTVTQYVNQTVNPSATTLAVGRRYLFTVTAAKTLPPLSTLTNGQSLEVTRRGEGDTRLVTISCSGTDTMAIGGTYVTSIVIPHYVTVVFTRIIDSGGTPCWTATQYDYAMSVESKFNDRYTKAESDARFAPIGLVTTVNNLSGTVTNGLNARYTKTESDARFAPISLVNTVTTGLAARYTKTESDNRYAPIALSTTVTNGLSERYTKTESDARYANAATTTTALNDRYTKTESDNRFAPISLVNTVSTLNTTVTNGLAARYTKTESDARYFTQTASDARYAPISLVNTVSTLNTTVTNGLNARYTKTESDNRYAPIGLSTTVTNGLDDRYTKTQSDARYAPIGLVNTVNVNSAWIADEGNRRTNSVNQRNRYAYVDNAGVTHIGNALAMYEWVSNAAVRRGGLVAGTLGVGFSNTAGNLTVYVDPTGILQLPNGNNSGSDIRFKHDIVDYWTKKPISDTVRIHSPDDLPYCEWVWNDMDGVFEGVRGKKGYGHIAQFVRQVFPECVNENADGYLGVDYVKFSVAMIAWKSLPWYMRTWYKLVKRFR